ncbi:MULTISPECIES: phosphate ABC transporter permease subunit PstC [Bacillaceae]|uniref:phosphate ABC transporter permease subunit PstC n=1 Tax=Bacillaceae TaxID=186817 RepID=UPI001E3540A1|nr:MULTISPECIES: phosphate ABC transporter permease subunit PstC [Bacillaceae]MCE4049976.1 phosphate ABC transporter permease subunit PstC [Bacillus sp. Au-Bac7]MCM3032763.1 phosphate ABC transporter permease subunit PstC [Niallia sp. MER 6]MDL0436887.1 phosphate ABC transporter permease subunit PstC [Niallia sp. SS-2023]UPO88040.1 phosphate ABC transporter permease subunit PstC [Niallia sp. Man26]
MEKSSLPVRERLIKSNKTRLNGEVRGRVLVTLCAIIMISATIAITIFLSTKGLQSFIKNGVSPIEFLTSTNWNPTDPESPMYGALPFIFGSFAVTMLAALVAAPLGIGGAIFMTEIAPSWGKKILQPVIELLVGIPSVVYGFIGLTVLVPFIREHVGGLGFSLLSGTIVLAIMILPTVTTIATDAMATLPKSLREGSYALGATRWQTIRKVLVPAALPSLLTAVVLGMARAFGEALAVQMVIGNTRIIPESILDPAGTLTTIITLNMGHTTYGSIENNTLWSMGLILLIMSFAFILLIRYLSSRRKI